MANKVVTSLGFTESEQPVVVVQMTDPNSTSVTSQSSSVASLSSLAQGAVATPRPNDRTPLLRHTRLFRSLSGGTQSPQQTTCQASSTRRLATFSGCFTPVCLSMFSAILFLRIGKVERRVTTRQHPTYTILPVAVCVKRVAPPHTLTSFRK